MSKLVLVVDDSMLIRHTVCRFLEERGFSVESATNGRDALDSITRQLPDLVITDLQMPGMSGNQLISALKRQPATANLPVVVLSSCNRFEDEVEDQIEYAICKDIDIEEQLEKALIETLGSASANSASAGR